MKTLFIKKSYLSFGKSIKKGEYPKVIVRI